MPSSAKTIRFWAVAAIWLATMFFFCKKELVPATGAASTSLPRLQLSSSMLFREEWLGIFYGDRQLGYSHTSLYPYQEKDFYGPALENSLWLELPLPGIKNRLTSFSFCLFSPSGEIRRLEIRAENAHPSIQLEGRTEGENLVLTLGTPEKRQEFRIPLPRHSLPIYTLTPFLALRPLKTGDTFTLPALDIPKSLTARAIETSAIGFRVTEQDERGYHLTSSYEGIPIEIWLNPSGEVTRATTGIGWEIRKQTHQEVLAYIKTSGTK